MKNLQRHTSLPMSRFTLMAKEERRQRIITRATGIAAILFAVLAWLWR